MLLSTTSTEDIHALVMFRGEAEQLNGYELIKDLSNFKQSLLIPSSLSTQQNASLDKKTFVVHLESNQRCSGQPKIKIKCQKLGVKMIRDILTKK
jgi:hypothetical protein